MHHARCLEAGLRLWAVYRRQATYVGTYVGVSNQCARTVERVG